MSNKIFRDINTAGVVYVMQTASQYGYSPTDKSWSNLGQGSPETGEIPGAIDRITHMDLNETMQGYLPVAGYQKLRENVADVYNKLFRQNHDSKYTAKNVVIGGGGRLVLSRTMLIFQNANVGYFLPEYASYRGILSLLHDSNLFPIDLSPSNGFEIDLEEVEKSIETNKLDMIMLSNPSNPTGNFMSGEKLRKFLEICKKHKVTIVIDEFYFNFIFEEGKYLSLSEFIEDVNSDKVIIISGTTKGLRYPGWRIAWTLAPEYLAEKIASVGTYLDGGANNAFQQYSARLFTYENIVKESEAINPIFDKKRKLMIKYLEDTFIKIASSPKGSFYMWIDISNLPSEINEDEKFFAECLKEKVIVVPGRFFDIRTDSTESDLKFRNYIRLSFGPEIEEIENGMKKILKVISKFSK